MDFIGLTSSARSRVHAVPQRGRRHRGLLVVSATVAGSVIALTGVTLPLGGRLLAPAAAHGGVHGAHHAIHAATGHATTIPALASPATPIVRSENSATTTTTDVSMQSQIRNVVVILADDLDTTAFDQVPRLKALHAQGLTLRNMVVTDSLCCPSRSSLLRSQYVHNHGVLSNVTASGGGWLTFHRKGEDKDCLPVWLHSAGIRTGFLGKYLNGYGAGQTAPVPPGWDRWFVPTTNEQMYLNYGYTVNSDGRSISYGDAPSDFLGDVLIHETVDFISTTRSPFYLQVNPTTPHGPYPVAARHRISDRSARIPRTADFNSRGLAEPRWRSSTPFLRSGTVRFYDRLWRQRVQSAESIADTVDAVRGALRRSGQLDSTLIIVTSDNGYHVGTHRLRPGKLTPYRTDTIVPTVILGPGIPAGVSLDAMTSMIDLGPTIADYLGAQTPDWVDGRSLRPLLSGIPDVAWRTGVISERLGRSVPGDPDYQPSAPPPYRALRTADWLYVEYEDGSRELYDLRADPDEIDNIIASAPTGLVDDLHAHLTALTACAGDGCRSADTWATSAA